MDGMDGMDGMDWVDWMDGTRNHRERASHQVAGTFTTRSAAADARQASR